jgi:hypothetical protein
MQPETGPAEQSAFGDKSAGVLPPGHTSFQQLLPEQSTAGALLAWIIHEVSSQKSKDALKR